MANDVNYNVGIHFSSDGTEKVQSNVSTLQSSLNKLKTTVSGLGLGIAIKKIGGAIGGYLSKASDFIETTNLFKVSLGSASDEAENFISKAEKILGLDPGNMMNAYSSFYNLAEGFGIASDKANFMSKNLTQLTADLSSFGNISLEEAQRKLMSGFSGQVEPLRKYGIALNQAALQETLYSLGIDQKVKNLSNAAKTELIYYQIMSSTEKMQGDLGRSMMSPANAARALQTEFNNLGKSIGLIFLPIAMKIIPIVRAISHILSELAAKVASFFGIKWSDYSADLSDLGKSANNATGGFGNVSKGIGNIGNSADKTTKKLNKMLMPFDELNNINFDTGTSTKGGSSSGADSGIGVGAGAGLGLELPGYDMFSEATNKAEKKILEIKDKIKSLLPIIGIVTGALAGMWAIIKIMQAVKWLNEVRKALKDMPKLANVLKGTLGLAFEIGGAFLLYKGLKKAIDDNFDWASVLMMVGGTGLIAAGLALQFSSTIPLQFGLGIIIGIVSAKLIHDAVEKMIHGDFSPQTILELIGGTAGTIAAGVFIFKTVMKLKVPVDVGLDGLTDGAENLSKSEKKISKSSKSISKSSKDLGKGTVSLKTGVNSLLKSIGMAGTALATLYGVSLVIDSMTGLLDTFAKSGLSTSDALKLLSGVLGGITIVFSVMVGVLSKFTPSWPAIVGAAVIIAGIAASLYLLQGILEIVVNSGADMINVGTGLLEIFAGLSLLVIALAAAGALLQSPMAMGGVLIVTVAIAAILGVLYLTLPTILDAVSSFITDTAPSVIQMINAITAGISQISLALGVSLPPVILALGKVFETVFSGISQVVAAVGNTIVSIVNSIGINVRAIVNSIGLGIIGIVNTVGNSISSIVTSIGNAVSNIVSTIGGAVSSIVTSIGNTVSNIISSAGSAISSIIGSIGNVASSIVSSVGGTISSIVSSVGSSVSSIIDSVGNTVSKILNGVKNVIRQVSDSIRDVATTVIWFANNISPAINILVNNIRKAIVGMVNLAVSAFEYLINRAADTINILAEKAKGIPYVGGKIHTVGYVHIERFNGYAEGGVPENGELFWANEAGPEFIGRIGNRTAVANKEQMTTSIENAAYRGVSRALAENSSDSTPHVVVNLGDEKIYSGYAQYQNRENNRYGVTV